MNKETSEIVELIDLIIVTAKLVGGEVKTRESRNATHYIFRKTNPSGFIIEHYRQYNFLYIVVNGKNKQIKSQNEKIQKLNEILRLL